MNEELNIKKEGVKHTVKEVQSPIKKGLKTKDVREIRGSLQLSLLAQASRLLWLM